MPASNILAMFNSAGSHWFSLAKNDKAHFIMADTLCIRWWLKLYKQAYNRNIGSCEEDTMVTIKFTCTSELQLDGATLTETTSH